MTAGLGLEKIGLLSLRFPWASLIVIALLTPLFVYGANKLEFSSDLREIFQSKSAEFATLDEVDAIFPDARQEIQIVVQNANLLEPSALDRLRDLQNSLEGVEGVANVQSMFTLNRLPGQDGAGTPLIPENPENPENANLEQLRDTVLDHPAVPGQLLSQDASLAVFAVSLEGGDRSVDDDREIVGRIRDAATAALEGSELTSRLTGLSVMRVEIIGALIRDQQTLRYGAMAAGLLICWVVFRKLRYVLLAGVPAAVAVTWLLGGMFFTGQEINVLTNVIPTIVLVIVFSDSVHLLFAVRGALEQGEELRAAIDRAVREVGPACVLTSLTTTLALASLTLVEHQFIARFGMIAAAGTALALVVTLMVMPALSLLTLRNLKTGIAETHKDLARRAIEGVCRGAVSAVRAAPRVLTAFGLLLAIGAGWVHSLNEPRYRYVDNLPRDNPAYDAISAVNEELGGANEIKVQIDWPQDYDFASEQTLDAVRDVHQALEEEERFNSVSSLTEIADALGEGQTGRARLVRLMGQGNAELLGNLAAPGETATLVTARFGNLTAAELVPPLDRLEQRLGDVRDKYPDAEITVTGIVPISAEASYTMIRQLNISLLIAIVVIILLIAVALRSPASGIVSILPNILPVAVGGLYLYLAGEGLQFTGVVAFTIGFGLAVDSTIHMLNRYRIERERTPNLHAAIEETVMTVGPVVFISTLVVASGLGVAMASELPMVRLYGEVAVVVLVASLIANLFILPAALIAIERWRGKK